jgi:hypothetical protein
MRLVQQVRIASINVSIYRIRFQCFAQTDFFNVILIFFQIDGNSERNGGWQDLVKTIKKQ